MATFHENLVQSFHNFRDKYLKANGNFFKFSYDATTQKYGFTINGTFHPFKTVQASKTVAAGTSAKTVTPDSGYDGIASVTVNPTPSQTKSVTAGTSDKTVSPDSGKLLSSVTVNPTPSQNKSASPSTSAQTISPDSGKLLSSVSISAISPQRTAGTAATLTGIDSTGPFVYFPYGWWPSVDADYGCYTRLTRAQAQAAHAHTGTRASVTSNGTIDLGETHNIRYVPVSVSSTPSVKYLNFINTYVSPYYTSYNVPIPSGYKRYIVIAINEDSTGVKPSASGCGATQLMTSIGAYGYNAHYRVSVYLCTSSGTMSFASNRGFIQSFTILGIN